MTKEPESVTVSKLVEDRAGHVRWAVTGTFVGVGGSEPRCIEYRVRVVPRLPTKRMAAGVGRQVSLLLVDDANRERAAFWHAAESSAPPEGIPRRVFEEASQTKLLQEARRQAKGGRLSAEASRFLAGQNRPRRGRPPARSLGEKLRILADVERAFATPDGKLEDVARAHDMSHGSLRNLLAWARGDADPQLFTGTSQGRRGGELTPEARMMLKKVSV